MDASLFWNLVGLASLVLSISALVVSASAKKAVRKAAENAIQKKDLKEDSDRLHQLIASLVVAKDIAMRRQRGAPPHLSVGQDPAQDLHHLRHSLICGTASVKPLSGVGSHTILPIHE